MTKNGLDPDERPIAKFIPDFELAYVYQRYKEVFFNFKSLDSWFSSRFIGRRYFSVRRSVIKMVWNGAIRPPSKILLLNPKSATLSSFFGVLKLSPTELHSTLTKSLPKML